MRKRAVWIAAITAALAVVGGRESVAGKPKPQPPADPAIVFCWSGSLKVMNEDGTNQVTVVSATSTTRRSQGVTNADPDWSPDGTQIVFASNADDPNGTGLGLYLVNRDGSGRHKILSPIASRYDVFGLTPAWSPGPVPGIGGGAQRIAYVAPAVAGGRLHLWIVDVDGSDPVDLGGMAGADIWSPTWSPSGTRLACQVRGDTTAEGRDRFGLVDFGGAGTTDFVSYPAPLSGYDVGRPSWSKTRENVMVVEASHDWSGTSPSQFDLWVLDPTNLAAAPVNLTATPTLQETHASFSPDDSKLVFKTAGVGTEAMNADGSGRHLISSTGHFPTWRRNP